MFTGVTFIVSTIVRKTIQNMFINIGLKTISKASIKTFNRLKDAYLDKYSKS